MAKELSAARCLLLTIHYASSANIKALHSFTPTRPDALDPELVLRVLLTYLPESTEPREYTKYVEEVASRLYLDYEREDVEVDISPVKDISEEQAQKQVKKLHLLEIRPPKFPPHAPKDLLTAFLCHRAYRVDEETGLLNLVPQLIEPFLERNDYLRTWYVSVVLPVLRLEFEYYPQQEPVPEIALPEFEKLEGNEGIEFLLKKAEEQESSASKDATPGQKRSFIARDVKGLVGPWMYGHTERKRRKLEHDQGAEHNGANANSIEEGVRKIALSGVSEEDKTGHDWEQMFKWMVGHARENFPLVTHCIEDWDGPSDVDLGGLETNRLDYLDDDMRQKLDAQYAQAAFAACYAVQADSHQTVKDAHSILARLAELLDFIPPPDLATSVESLPKIERHATKLEKSQSVADLAPLSLLQPEHPLTTPRFETYMLLQMMVYTAYQVAGLGQPMSLVNVAKLHFYASADEQLSVLQKILRGLAKSGARKDEPQWTADRGKLLWLWNWGIDSNDEHAVNGAGVLGKIDKETFEEEMLKVFIETSCYDLAIRLYLKDGSTRLPKDRIEQIALAKAMETYDGASNGNRNRGGMKRASDTVAAFRPFFPGSIAFRQATSLISATHALSFYSLILQHGVPFQPVNIRVSSDPVGLIDKVLDQNPNSYTKLDDLIDIAQNLVAAGLPQPESDGLVEQPDAEDLACRKKDAERRVTFMAVEAALREDDFETAYSYIVNRLTPSGADIAAPEPKKAAGHARSTSSGSTQTKRDTEDDTSWRAAFLAGRYRASTSSPPTLRRLEQRTELLSLALLLAPTSALTEILAAWRRCEEETTALQRSQHQAEEEFDDRADKRTSISALPGNFTVSSEQPELLLNQRRRELGRIGAGGTASEGQAPMSMFDLTRSAARAISQNAFPLAAARQRSSMGDSVDSLGSDNSIGQGQQSRVRKRDMVANAVSGGLASGLGWVLGATPVGQQPQHEDE